MSTETETSNDGPLSIAEAVAAYTAVPAEEADPGQSEADDEQDGALADDELLADEGSAEDGEPADDDQADSDDDSDSDDESESDQGRFVSDNAKVRLTDGTVTTIADLKAGSLKNADYTQKTQALAAERETVSVQSERIKQQEKQVTEQAAYVADLLRTIVPPPPDPSLADPRSPNYDPMAYMAAEASHKQWAAHLNYLDQQRQQADQTSQAKQTEEATARAQKEWAALAGKVPSLKDQKRAASFFSEIESYAKAEGYTIPELQAAISQDHRQAVTLHKAALWDKLQAAKKAKAPTAPVENRPPVQKGGKRLNPAAAQARQAAAAMERLNKSGSVRDGVAAYLATQSKG